jgi:hypothetical protein
VKLSSPTVGSILPASNQVTSKYLSSTPLKALLNSFSMVIRTTFVALTGLKTIPISLPLVKMQVLAFGSCMPTEAKALKLKWPTLNRDSLERIQV